MGKQFADQQNWAEAERLYRESIALWPNTWAYYHLAHAVMEQERYDEAIELNVIALKRIKYSNATASERVSMETISYIYFNLGVCYLNKDNIDMAIKYYQYSLRYYKNDFVEENLAKLEELKAQRLAEEQRQKEEEKRRKEEKKRIAAYQKKEAKAVPKIKKDVDTLVADIGKQSEKSDLGQPQSIYRIVDGKLVEFTIEPHPKDGPGTAGEQLKSIEAAGQGAGGASKREIASDRSQLGFDTPASEAGSLPTTVVDGRNPGSNKPLVPKEYKKDPEIIKFLAQKEKADQTYNKLGKELKDINDKIANKEGDVGGLQVAASKIMDQMTQAKSASDAATVNVQERVRKLTFGGVDLTEEDTGPKKEPPPPVNPDGPSQP